MSDERTCRHCGDVYRWTDHDEAYAPDYCPGCGEYNGPPSEELDKDDVVVCVMAMQVARKAFEDYIEEVQGMDASFWDIDMTGYVLDHHFKRWKRVTVEELVVDEVEPEAE